MQIIENAELAELEARAGVVSRGLLWVTAKNRFSGEPESVGFWNGQGARAFTIGGEVRTYHGPLVLNMPAIDGGVGLEVRMLRIPLAHLSPEVEQALRGYDPRLAPVEIHNALLSRETNNLLADPRRMFKGFIDEAPISTGSEGAEGSAELVLASAARVLTRSLSLYRSNADQIARDPDDRGREYGTTNGLKQVPWGEGDVRPPPPKPEPDDDDDDEWWKKL